MTNLLNDYLSTKFILIGDCNERIGQNQDIPAKWVTGPQIKRW